MLYNIPIESLDERYSAQWNKIFPEEFKKRNINFTTIYPEPLDNKINTGKFLDIIGTNYFKSKQLTEICQLLNEGKVKDGDIFFFHDLWFPGIEMLFYMRDALGINFKIAGMLHAGTYDEYDFLAQEGMEKWGEDLEKSWFKGLDFIFVATHFHKDLLEKTGRIDYHTRNKVYVTGFPLPVHIKLTEDDYEKKENIVVFPHRLDDEKNPQEFDILKCRLEGEYPDWEFIYTKEKCKTKQEYYELLKRAKIALSFSEQETWGIAQQEAFMSGCIPIVPNRLSYPEMYGLNFLYEDGVYEAIKKVKYAIKNYDTIRREIYFSHNIEELKFSSHCAILNMITMMGVS